MITFTTTWLSVYHPRNQESQVIWNFLFSFAFEKKSQDIETKYHCLA